MVTLDWIYSSKKSTKRSHKTMFSARVTPNSVPKKSTHSRDRSIVDLPSDVIVTALSFLKPIEVDKNLIRVSKVLSHEAQSEALWKGFCRRTGKYTEEYDNESLSCSYKHYFKVPCVPDDFPTIKAALRFIDPQERRVTVQKGVYEESIVVGNDMGLISPQHPITIAAKDGAGVTWTNGTNEPCFSVQAGANLVLIGLHLFHSTEGNDIWNGNSAVLVKGSGRGRAPSARITLKSCSITSKSGRGVVAVDGASLRMQQSSVQDCVATGVYVGESQAVVTHCSISRNGAGSGVQGGVPPGHSGVFVEADSRVELSGSLVANNYYTGISSLRGARVRMEFCDVTGNGSFPFVINDPFDARHFDDDDDDDSVQGELVQVSHASGETTNNFVDQGVESPLRPQVGPPWTKDSFVEWFTKPDIAAKDSERS